jgi:hypothetical protein
MGMDMENIFGRRSMKTQTISQVLVPEVTIRLAMDMTRAIKRIKVKTAILTKKVGRVSARMLLLMIAGLMGELSEKRVSCVGRPEREGKFIQN